MTRPCTYSSILTLVLALSVGACSKKLPPALKAVPADADVIVTADAQSLLTFAKQVMLKAFPAEIKDKVPSMDMLLQKAVEMIGIDLTKLTRVTVIGFLGSEERMALLAEGLEGKGLKGEKQGDRNGITLYSIASKVHYADLAGVGLAVAPSAEMLQQVVDAHAGKAKSIADTDRGKLFEKLSKLESGLSQIRVYLLTGKLPGQEAAPFVVKGGAFVADLDKGAAAMVLSDESGAKQMKTAVDIGLMGVRTGLAMGKGMDLPFEIDEETKKTVTNLLNKLSTEQDGEMVSMTYRGELRPLIEKAVALGFKEYVEQAKATRELTDEMNAVEGEGAEEAGAAEKAEEALKNEKSKAEKPKAVRAKARASSRRK